MRPYLVIEYQRKHYILSNGNAKQLRITIDDNMRFWFFPLNQSGAILIKDPKKYKDDVIRIEIKMEGKISRSRMVQGFVSYIRSIGAIPIISKKQEGLNAVKLYYDSTYANLMYKELEEIEIESKLDVSGKDINLLFARFYELLESDPLIPVDHSYPFIFTTASINHYWKSRGVEAVKIVSKVRRLSFVLKSDLKILSKPCHIIERREVKKKKIVWAGESLDKTIQNSYGNTIKNIFYAGHLARVRKAVWLRNVKNNRIYHVSIDACKAEGKTPLTQLEVEYTGRLASSKKTVSKDPPTKKREIVDDIELITKRAKWLFTQMGVVTKKGIEKFKWLTT
jgi:hypothetical protein